MAKLVCQIWKTIMKTINWNVMSELGLIRRINTEILHPIGLAISRNPENGHSEEILISDDGEWEYSPDIQAKSNMSDDDIRIFLTKVK